MRWKATIAYNGAHYCGWQVQPNGLSVQEVVENALAKIVKSPVGAVSSGRTDAGVHAKGQVFHFDCDLNMTGEQWRLALNSLLPDDMIIRKVEEADPNFHSRFDALWKRYDYVINMGEYDPFMKDLEFEYNKRLDVRAMRTAAGYLVGTHDFTSFNANSLEERPNQTRTIYEITISEHRGKVTISYAGNGFLRYMVRMMTGILIEVGKKKIRPEKVRKLMEKKSKTAVNYNAVPNGLYLMEVGYSEYVQKLQE